MKAKTIQNPWIKKELTKGALKNKRFMEGS